MVDVAPEVTHAAGGVVWRASVRGIEVALVYRAKYDDWTLPKGGVEEGESLAGAALREVEEETGVRCELGEPLPAVEWSRADGTRRRVHWWLMRPQRQGQPAADPDTSARPEPEPEPDAEEHGPEPGEGHDRAVVVAGSGLSPGANHQTGPRAGDTVTECEWLLASDALARLTYERDRATVEEALARIPAEDGSVSAGGMARVGRACAAVLREGLLGTEILMVRHRQFWTLPGGGILPGETSSEAARRELKEETGLDGAVVRELFDGCWLVATDPVATVIVGIDPELEPHEQVLRGAAWFTLEEKAADRQVAQVIAALGRNDAEGSG